MPNVLLNPHSPAGSSGPPRELDVESPGFKEGQMKNLRKKKTDKKPNIMINRLETEKGEKEKTKPEKSPGMRKSAIRPITKKNLLDLQKAGAPKMTESKSNFIDIVKQSARDKALPAEATTTDGTIYSQTPFMKKTNEIVGHT